MRSPTPDTVAVVAGFAAAFAPGQDRDLDRIGDRVGVLIPRPLQKLFALTAFGGDEDFEYGDLVPDQLSPADQEALAGVMERFLREHLDLDVLIPSSRRRRATTS
jgi:hypothetical protein